MELLSVSEFNKVINLLLSDMGEFAVTGEITQLKFSQNGAVFMDLKDKQENAILRISQYAPRVEGLKAVSEGMEVVVYGYPEIYSPSGSFGFKPRKIEPVGEGALKQAFENLKRALASQGYFAAERKRPLPRIIQRVALITGKDSAAYADFTKILHENSAAIAIDFYPVLVQGERAPAEIAAAFETAAMREVEAIVLIRGGGSLEDLQAFNTELVAKAIYNSRLPVVVGVGHEIDTSIADMVADVRAATPSQAAYYLVSQNQNFIQELNLLLENCELALTNALPSIAEIETLVEVLETRLTRIIPPSGQIKQYESLFNSQLSAFKMILQSYRARILNVEKSSTDLLNFRIEHEYLWLDKYLELLNAYNPEKVLARGYALVSTDQMYISSVASLRKHQQISIKLKDGKLSSEILDITLN